jgi:hypothetical protein
MAAPGLRSQVGCEITDVEKPEDIANAQILIFPGERTLRTRWRARTRAGLGWTKGYMRARATARRARERAPGVS